MRTMPCTASALVTMLAIGAGFGALEACGNRNATDSDAGMGGRRCTTNAECNDSIECTVDTCGSSNLCAYTAVDARCTVAGESCVIGVGCTSTRTCTEDGDCNDSIACTIDTCAAGNVCSYEGIDELCTDPMLPVCEIGEGCSAGAMRCTSDAECNDSVPCTEDVCNASATCEHIPVDSECDEAAGERCTPTGCFAAMSCTTEEECQDGNFCNGRERCIPELGCMPATMTPRCDDMDACTVDTCEPATGCVYTCDSSRPMCMCMGGIDCVGRFALSENLYNACIPDAEGNNQVDYDFMVVDIAIVAGQTIVTPVAPGRAHFGTLSDATASCPSVTAIATVPGGTTERYTLNVTFSDSDHFEGTFMANLGGIGGLLGCTEGSIPISGTRMP
jgi:hypothetical protein